jgi:hypothetical protein
LNGVLFYETKGSIKPNVLAVYVVALCASAGMVFCKVLVDGRKFNFKIYFIDGLSKTMTACALAGSPTESAFFA